MNVPPPRASGVPTDLGENPRITVRSPSGGQPMLRGEAGVRIPAFGGWTPFRPGGSALNVWGPASSAASRNAPRPKGMYTCL